MNEFICNHSKIHIKNKVTVLFSFCNPPLKGHIMSFKMYIQRSSSNQYHLIEVYILKILYNLGIIVSYFKKNSETTFFLTPVFKTFFIQNLILYIATEVETNGHGSK